ASRSRGRSAVEGYGLPGRTSARQLPARGPRGGLRPGRRRRQAPDRPTCGSRVRRALERTGRAAPPAHGHRPRARAGRRAAGARLCRRHAVRQPVGRPRVDRGGPRSRGQAVGTGKAPARSRARATAGPDRCRRRGRRGARASPGRLSAGGSARAEGGDRRCTATRGDRGPRPTARRAAGVRAAQREHACGPGSRRGRAERSRGL
ncbi:MAG: Molybdopterin-guanine dinucleotide biosynthesis protein MobA, partial [uncultured Solirubrobacterales bacterium]